MCAPTLSAVAVTVESVLGLLGSHVSTLHTLNVRTLPESTGVTAAEMRGGARSGTGSCAANSRSARRSRRSNCCATLGPASGAPGRGGAGSGLPPSSNPCESSGMLDADCGTTTYSMPDPRGFAGNTAHPDVWVGSIMVTPAYTSLTAPAAPPLRAAPRGDGGW